MELRKYFAILLLLLANILGIVYIMSKLQFIVFYKEFIVVVLFMLMLVISIYSFVLRYKYRFILNAIFFVSGIFNSIYLYFKVETFMLVLLVAANAFGFVIAINSIEARHKRPKKPKRRKKEQLLVEEIKPEIRPKEESKIIKEVKKELAEIKRRKEIEEFEKEARILQKAEEEAKRKNEILELKKEARILKEAEDKIKEIKKKYSPGKFVASKNSNKYHAPKCEWAKKIKRKQRIWFSNEEEAKKKGYSAHSCLK